VVFNFLYHNYFFSIKAILKYNCYFFARRRRNVSKKRLFDICCALKVAT